MQDYPEYIPVIGQGSHFYNTSTLLSTQPLCRRLFFLKISGKQEERN
jgi:hypothetical protein